MNLSARRIFLRYKYSRTVTVVYCFFEGGIGSKEWDIS